MRPKKHAQRTVQPNAACKAIRCEAVDVSRDEQSNLQYNKISLHMAAETAGSAISHPHQSTAVNAGNRPSFEATDPKMKTECFWLQSCSKVSVIIKSVDNPTWAFKASNQASQF
jgi:hypothetical protein